VSATPIPTQTSTTTATPPPTETPPVYYYIGNLISCCDNKQTLNVQIRSVGFTISLNDTVIVNIGDGRQCYFVEGLTLGDTGTYLVDEVLSGNNCGTTTCDAFCPTPTPTPAATNTPAPTITPSNTLNSLYIQDNCCNNPGQIYELTYLNSQAGEIPTTIGEVWVLSGNTGLTNRCYTIVSVEIDSYPQVPFNGDFVGQGNILFTADGSPYGNCTACTAAVSCKTPVTPLATPTNTPTPSITRSATPTPTVTPTKTRTPTPTPTKTTTPTPTVTPNCNCVGGSSTITIYESIAGISSSQLNQNITEWSSYLVPCVSGLAALPVTTNRNDLPEVSTDTFATKSYSFMVSFKYVQNGTASTNLRLAIGSGIDGDCSFGVYNIANPVSGTWYSLRVDIADISLYNNQIRVLLSEPSNSNYYYCGTAGDDSCCYNTNFGTGLNPTCPGNQPGCLAPIGYWCPY
jgi:hypothetical protein